LRVDRFLGKRPPAGAWLPFGGGVRRCVGAAFAQFEAKTVLDEPLRGLELRPAGRPSRWIGRRGIVLVPARGGPVVATRRSASEAARAVTTAATA
jgi:cytochrome P450